MDSCKFAVTLAPSATVTFLTISRNPAAVAETEYFPGCKRGKLKDPWELVVVEVELPVSTFFNLTDTPDTTAAVGSVTTPAMSPVVEVWAQRLETAATT